MKSTKKISRVQLSVTEHDETAFLGLVCSDPDYKLSLKINSKLKISLKSESPVKVGESLGKELLFSRFSDSAAGPDSVFHLFSNRSGADFFVKKLKNIDYLLEIYDPVSNFDLTKIISQLREIDTVTGVFTIEMKNLKDKNSKYLFL
jgi:hypothetical protein